MKYGSKEFSSSLRKLQVEATGSEWKRRNGRGMEVLLSLAGEWNIVKSKLLIIFITLKHSFIESEDLEIGLF